MGTEIVLYGRVVEPATAELIRDVFAKAGRHDPERAHGIEDELTRGALAAIRDGHPDPAGLARAVLTILDADYPRWFA
jgi:hypothetical protein